MSVLQAEKPIVYYRGATSLERKPSGSFKIKSDRDETDQVPSFKIESDRDETDQVFDNKFTRQLVEGIPLLNKPYEPVSVWGYNGHFQTMKFGLTFSRPGLKTALRGRVRLRLRMPDDTNDTTFSYDTFEPAREPTAKGVWVAIAPGLANSSDDCYLKALGTLLTSNGYQAAVLNPPGTIRTESLSTPRIFNFGCTEYYGAMVDDLIKKHLGIKLIAIGLSLGGNIVCKYLGEDENHRNHFIACISACQGYDFNEHRERTTRKKVARRFYLKRICGQIRDIILQNIDDLFPNVPNEERSTHRNLVRKLSKADRIDKIDELYTIKQTGHAKVEDYYTWASCSSYLDEITIPILFINAEDDPLFSLKQLDIPKNYTDGNENSLFVLTKHGGHLGFYQKTGTSSIDTYTWLDNLCLQYIDRLIELRLQPQNLAPGNVDNCEVEATLTNTTMAARDANSNFSHAQTQSTMAVRTVNDDHQITRL